MQKGLIEGLIEKVQVLKCARISPWQIRLFAACVCLASVELFYIAYTTSSIAMCGLASVMWACGMGLSAGISNYEESTALKDMELMHYEKLQTAKKHHVALSNVGVWAFGAFLVFFGIWSVSLGICWFKFGDPESWTFETFFDPQPWNAGGALLDRALANIYIWSLLALQFLGVLMTVKFVVQVPAVMDVEFERFVLRIEEAEDSINWDHLWVSLQRTQMCISKLMSKRECGLFFVVVLVTGSLGTLLSVLNMIWYPVSTFAFRHSAINLCIAVSFVLTPLKLLANVNDRIYKTGASAQSVLAAARRYPKRRKKVQDGPHLKEDAPCLQEDAPCLQEVDKLQGLMINMMESCNTIPAYHRFMQSMTDGHLGPAVYGIRITTRLVRDVCVKLITLVPAFVSGIKYVLATMSEHHLHY